MKASSEIQLQESHHIFFLLFFFFLSCLPLSHSFLFFSDRPGNLHLGCGTHGSVLQYFNNRTSVLTIFLSFTHACSLFGSGFFVAQHFQEAFDTTNRTPLQLSCSIFFFYFFFVVFVIFVCCFVAPVVNAAYFVLFDNLVTLAHIVLILDFCALDFHQISCNVPDDIALFV